MKKKIYKVFFEFVESCKFHIFSALLFLLCNENLNSFLNRVQKLFEGGNRSREETICGKILKSKNHHQGPVQKLIWKLYDRNSVA